MLTCMRTAVRASGFTNVSAFSGTQFAELMSTPGDALVADVAAPAGTPLAWSFAHRGRCDGADVVLLRAGPAGGALSSLVAASTTGTQWRVYSGAHTRAQCCSVAMLLRLRVCAVALRPASLRPQACSRRRLL